ncbi:hypothetical protein C2W64_01221 [Brevibacillus laterosporus]|nr:hypothetical protein C2W64_01221 [Brevibacillus laterosporus]
MIWKQKKATCSTKGKQAACNPFFPHSKKVTRHLLLLHSNLNED